MGCERPLRDRNHGIWAACDSNNRGMWKGGGTFAATCRADCINAGRHRKTPPDLMPDGVIMFVAGCGCRLNQQKLIGGGDSDSTGQLYHEKRRDGKRPPVWRKHRGSLCPRGRNLEGAGMRMAGCCGSGSSRASEEQGSEPG